MVGSYVDRYFEGTLDAFKSEHTEMFKKDGNLKAEYVKADALIQRAERDELFMKYMSGESRFIMTAELYGTPGKSKWTVIFRELRLWTLKLWHPLQNWSGCEI